MGMDLIGFLVKGPRVLPADNKSSALEQAMAVVEAAHQFIDLQDDPDGAKQQVVLTNTTLRHLGDVEMEVDDIVAYDKAAIVKLIKELFDWWNEGARDTVARMDPDDKEQVMVFAGEATWGDEPSGTGFEILRDLARLNLLDVFGIR